MFMVKACIVAIDVKITTARLRYMLAFSCATMQCARSAVEYPESMYVVLLFNLILCWLATCARLVFQKKCAFYKNMYIRIAQWQKGGVLAVGFALLLLNISVYITANVKKFVHCCYVRPVFQQ